MKDLTQLLEAIKNEDLPEIYCDLDEVLVDFLRAADAAVNGSFAKTDKETRWDVINQVKGFWSNIGCKPNAKRLHDFIIKYDPHVLSAFTGRDPTSKVGKMKWIKKNTGFKRANVHLVLRSQKKSYAKTKEEKPKFLKLPTGPGPFAHCSLGPRKLVEIVNSACDSEKEVED